MSATACEEQMKMHSGLFKELNSLPMVRSASSIVASAQKESRLLRSGMVIFEYSMTAMFDRIPGGIKLVSSLDSVAEKGIASLKERYPSITKSPEEIQGNAYGTVRKTVRAAMKTSPGQIVMGALDWALDSSSSTLKKLDKNMRIVPVTSRISEEHAYASEDSGTFDTEKKTPKEPQLALSVLTEQDSLIRKALKLGIIYPLENIIKSPRKRLQTSVWTKMKSTLLGFLGANSGGFFLNFTAKGPVSPGNPERKRRHDEILTDDGSESEDDLEGFDMDEYDSEADPDYVEPEKDSGEESEGDNSEGHPESDLDEIIEEGRSFAGEQAKLQRKITPVDNSKTSSSDNKKTQQGQRKTEPTGTSVDSNQTPTGNKTSPADTKKTPQGPSKTESTATADNPNLTAIENSKTSSADTGLTPKGPNKNESTGIEDFRNGEPKGKQNKQDHKNEQNGKESKSTNKNEGTGKGGKQNNKNDQNGKENKSGNKNEWKGKENKLDSNIKNPTVVLHDVGSGSQV